MRISVAVTPGVSCARATAGAARAPAAINTCLLPSILFPPLPLGARVSLHVRALDDVAEADPAFAVPALQLHVADRVVVVRAGADLHAGQQRRQLERRDIG